MSVQANLSIAHFQASLGRKLWAAQAELQSVGSDQLSLLEAGHVSAMTQLQQSAAVFVTRFPTGALTLSERTPVSRNLASVKTTLYNDRLPSN